MEEEQVEKLKVKMMGRGKVVVTGEGGGGS